MLELGFIGAKHKPPFYAAEAMKKGPEGPCGRTKAGAQNEYFSVACRAHCDSPEAWRVV